MNDEEPGLLGKHNFTQILEQIFDYDAQVSSYACRTGISIEGTYFSALGGAAGQDNSLAQKMADTWLVNINAFKRRSNYELRLFVTLDGVLLFQLPYKIPYCLSV